MSLLEKVRVVLVETSHPGNIGATARAMKTMGLSDLVLVRPKRFPDPQALWRAAGGEDVLIAAKVVDDLSMAIADCHWVVATSARQRRIPWPVLSPRDFALSAAVRSGQQIAIIFGREDKGLTNDELQLCHSHVEIPGNPEYPILNVAMAVQVIAYELFQQAVPPPASLLWDRPLASSEAIEGFMAHLEAVLKASKFVDSDNPGQTMTRFRRLFSRVELDITEVAMLRGLLKQVCPEAGSGHIPGPP
jgi:tRNA (cytidine32/uridine32-2'-O)-methyltransferase